MKQTSAAGTQSFASYAPARVHERLAGATPVERSETLLARVHSRLASAGIRRPRILRGPRLAKPVDASQIRTSRLLLRPHRSADAAHWFALQSHPSVLEFLPWPVRGRAASQRHLKDRTRRTRLWQSNDIIALAIERDGVLIGDVSLHLREVHPAAREVEISWVLNPDHSGSGFATEAAEAALGFAFACVGARWVTAVTNIRNERSLALATRLGFLPVRSDGTTVVLMMSAGSHDSTRRRISGR